MPVNREAGGEAKRGHSKIFYKKVKKEFVELKILLPLHPQRKRGSEKEKRKRDESLKISS